jgi:hypothetical protein
MDWWYIAYVIIGIIILIIIYKAVKKSPEKYYRKASRAHRKGEKFYTIGDDELADDYYQEADYYRKKAEELKVA